MAGIERVIAYRRLRHWVAPLEAGNLAFASGRVLQALGLYTQASERARTQPRPRFYMGYAHLFLWRLAAARQDLEASVLLRPLATDFDCTALPALALLDALEGHVSEARQRLDELQANSASGCQRLAEAVLACREQRWTDVLSFTEHNELLDLGGTLGALGATLFTWSAVELGEPAPHVDRVSLFSEAGPAELYAAWPELRAFLERAPLA